MTAKLSAERDRQRRLARPVPTRSPPLNPQDRSGGAGWVPVVIRSVDTTANTMTCQRIRYTDVPPVIGNYEEFGRVEACYPLPTADVRDYEIFVWPAKTTANNESVANPVTQLTVPCLALADPRGFLIVMLAFKHDASILDPSEQPNECSDG